MKRRFYRNPNPDAAWLAAHPGWVSFRSPTLKQDEFRKLRVATEFWSAEAIWKKSSGAWSCVSADSYLSWMIGKSHEQTHLELLKLGADYSWVKEPKLDPVEVTARPLAHPSLQNSLDHDAVAQTAPRASNLAAGSGAETTSFSSLKVR